MKKQNQLLMLTLLSSTLLSAQILPGLWFANVEVTKVNEVHSSSTNANKLTPVSYPFNLQLLMHTDASGKTKLLKEVFVMQTKDGNTSDDKIKRVLVTDEKKIKNYDGIIRKGDNKLVAVRLTTPSFDFNGSSWDLEGSIKSDDGSTIKGEHVLHDQNHSTNPFRHQFHPEHKTGFTLDRSFTITIKNPNKGNKTAPIQGRSKLSGIYTETIVGLHKAPLKVSGTINLSRVSRIDVLNATK